MLRARGFTLLEVLVALAILAVLLSSVTLVLPDPVHQQQRESLRAWQRQAESAARWAESEARPWAWQIGPRSARLLQYDAGRWQPAAAGRGDWLALGGGLELTALEIDGQRREPGSLVVYSGVPPLYALHLSDGQRRWLLSGLPSGRVSLEALP